MRDLSRREFLRLGATAAAAVPLSRIGPAVALTPARLEAVRALTTLERRIVRGPVLRRGAERAYHRLKPGPGEPHVVRTELAKRAGVGPRRPLLSFVHYTDTHILDAQSPLRVEWLDRYDDGTCRDAPSRLFPSAYRPQEALTLHFLESMNRRVRRIGLGPVTGRPLQFVMATGDNIDNEQYNELRWFIDLMDGGRTVDPNSGGAGYEGVQAEGLADPEYWHPDPVSDKYKELYGYPDYPGLFEQALRPFRATGVGLPWLQTFGNHDGLIQGNFPKNNTMNTIAVGPVKVVGPPPGLNPCTGFAGLLQDPAALFTGPAMPVVADPNRRVVLRSEYISEHFRTSGRPVGHGFTRANLRDGTAYYAKDLDPRIRLIALDTVNPGGQSSGSVGDAQLRWLEARLAEVHSGYLDAQGNAVRTRNRDRLVILVSHHGLRSLDSVFENPDPFNPNQDSDTPRHHAEEVEAVVHRFPNVIAWVNGHTHVNEVVSRPNPRPKAAGTPGFWDINTAAHIDWNCASRIVEVVLNANRTISIFCTMIDDDSPADPRGATGVRRVASILRELGANDYQKGLDSQSGGKPKDRNVELVLPAPAWLR